TSHPAVRQSAAHGGRRRLGHGSFLAWLGGLTPGASTMRLSIELRTSLAAAMFAVAAGCSGASAPTGPVPPGPGPAATDSVAVLEDLSSRQVFPTDNWWNLDISGAPVDAQSQAMIDWISGKT